MKDLMKYKGHYGTVCYDPDEPIFYGKIAFIKALITYEAMDAVGIKNAFEDAVDDYLVLCESEGVKPETPFKGSLNVRLGPKLHEKIALEALKNNLTINGYICHLLNSQYNQRDNNI